ncbi:hypothetical protein [Rubritalea tangerina]|uniref:hypothetical protein n=1 Tax=Rubritalea tangerina TaxID=430798 RepID=UPI00360D7094
MKTLSPEEELQTGKPYAGNPHVRFGGRGGATQCAVPTLSKNVDLSMWDPRLESVSGWGYFVGAVGICGWGGRC